ADEGVVGGVDGDHAGAALDGRDEVLFRGLAPALGALGLGVVVVEDDELVLGELAGVGEEGLGVVGDVDLEAAAGLERGLVDAAGVLPVVVAEAGDDQRLDGRRRGLGGGLAGQRE